MKLFKKQISLDFDGTPWDLEPELFVIHQILEKRDDIILLAKSCFPKAKNESCTVVGRDGMTLEQIIRSAIFKQHRRLTFKELSRTTLDSAICKSFLKMPYGRHFSAQTLQENIATISVDALLAIQTAIALSAITFGVDDGKKIRTDSTVIKTNIHHPTNASLLYDCVQTAGILLGKCKALKPGLRCRSYRKGSKSLLFKIVNTKGPRAKEKRLPLYKKLLKHTISCENQVAEVIDILACYTFNDCSREKQREKLLPKLTDLLSKMQQVQNVAYRREILDESVPVAEKIFSIFEDHTDCIVKGGREVLFGHKVNFSAGVSNFIFDCIIERGNPADTSYFPKTIDNLRENLRIVPESIAGDGAYASIANRDYAHSKNIKNIVFNKIRGTLQNIASSKNMETRLKKWRAGMEAVISNFKRGLKAGVCNWKGWEAFQKFVLWNMLTFNLRVIGHSLINQLA